MVSKIAIVPFLFITMRPQIVTQTGTGTTSWIPLNTKKVPFNVGLGCVVSGTVTYTIQHTFDDVLGGSSATAFNHDSLVNRTDNQDGNYAFPVAGVRIDVSAGSGSITLTMLQG